ncbi:MAG: hypothetical protein ACK504_02945, partial [Bacteroidota bacterium]
PLAFATQGMRFKTGLFEVLVTSVQGGAGYFSGTGKVFVPLFGSLINVTFNNVFVDDNQTVLTGDFFAVTKGIKNWIKDWEVIQDSLNKVFTNFNNSKDTTALINSLQQMCQDVQQSGDSAFINAFNGVLTPTISNNKNTPLFCSSDNNAIKQYLASHPNSVSGWQSNSNLFDSNSNSIAGASEQGYFSHGIQPTDYAEYKNWIAPAQDLATKKLNAGIYIITPSVNFDNKVVYYSAYYKWVVSATWFNSQNIPNDNGVAYRNDWTIEPKDIGKFINYADEWGKSSAFLHNFGSDYKLRPDVIQYLDGNYLEALKLQWKAALKDPIFWLSLAHTSVSLFDVSASKFAKTNFIKEVNIGNNVKSVWWTPYKINNIRVRLRTGTNTSKVAVIGRKMTNVNALATELRQEIGNNKVLVFDQSFLDEVYGGKIPIDGTKYNFEQLKINLSQNGNVPLSELPNTPMYKANLKFVEYLNNKNYPIYDCGFPIGESSSGFYNMELEHLFNE